MDRDNQTDLYRNMEEETLMPEVFDLANAFVYYVVNIRPGRSFDDIISVINYSGIKLEFTGSPSDVIYTPDPLGPNVPFTTASFYGADFTNDTDATDTQLFSKTVAETATFSLSFTEGVKVGATTTLTTKIPFVAEGKVELSAEGSFSSTQNDTSSTTQSFTFSDTIPVPPRKRVVTTLLIDSLNYTGTVMTKVLVSGPLTITYGSNQFKVDVVDVFRAIKDKPPGNFQKTDKRATYTFTDVDLARFEVTSTNEVLYTATAAIQAKFGGRKRTTAKQYDLRSGLMETEFTF